MENLIKINYTLRQHSVFGKCVISMQQEKSSFSERTVVCGALLCFVKLALLVTIKGLSSIPGLVI
jgi:hypothetical protein